MSENQNNRNSVGRLSSTGGNDRSQTNAASGDAAYNATRPADAGRVPSHDVPEEPPPRRLRRLHRVWPDRDGNISYLLTMCVDGRGCVLDNETTFERFVSFLLDSPTRYHWFSRRFVVMPDHIHLIAHQGHDALRLGQWIKALKAVVGGLERRQTPDAASGDTAYNATPSAAVGRVSSRGDVVGPVSLPGVSTPPHEFTRIKRAWRWQDGYHDHKFRTPESETRKWEYVCLNPVRAGLVKRLEEWPFGGEIFYDEARGPRLVRGTPPLLEAGMLIEETPGKDRETPREGARPTT